MRFGLLMVMSAAGILGIAPSPVHAANPRVTLKLKQVTATEAAEALSRASGEKLAVILPARSPEAANPGLDGPSSPRKDFDWVNLSFARAARQLAEQFQLGIHRDAAGRYTLTPTGPPAGRAGQPASPIDVAGFRFCVPQLSVQNQLELDFREAHAPGFVVPRSGRLQLQVQLELPEGEVDSIIGLENVTAKDDTGTLLIADSRFSRFGPRPSFGNTFNDTYDEMVHLDGPSPRATKLTWVEGEVMVYGTNRQHSVEFTAPFPASLMPKPIGSITITSLQFEERQGSTTLAVEMTQPLAPGQLPRRPELTVIAVGASGREFVANQGSSSGSGTGGLMTFKMKLGLGKLDEAVTRVVFKHTVRSDPKRLVAFRLKDIPLPQEGIFVPNAVRRPPPRIGALVPPMPQTQLEKSSGVAMVSTVRISGAAAPAGTLSIGLSKRSGNEWGAVRWQDVPVSTTGVAKLEGVEPGAYRVLRIYRPTVAINRVGTGLWAGSEVEVTVARGVEATLPALEWLMDAPRPVAPRPAAKPVAPGPKLRKK